MSSECDTLEFFDGVINNDLETVKCLIDNISREDLEDALKLAEAYGFEKIIECIKLFL